MEEYSFRVNFEFICLNFAEFLGGCILVTRLKVVCMLKRCILHTVCKRLRPIVQDVGFRHCLLLNRLQLITLAVNVVLGARIIGYAKNRIQDPYTILGILQTTFRC